jgi:hypothetical protein
MVKVILFTGEHPKYLRWVVLRRLLHEFHGPSHPFFFLTLPI